MEKDDQNGDFFLYLISYLLRDGRYLIEMDSYRGRFLFYLLDYLR